MKNYYGSLVSDEDFEFITDMESYVDTCFGFAISSPEISIYIEPLNNTIEVHSLDSVFNYNTVKDFLFNHIINGEKIIDSISNFEFDVT